MDQRMAELALQKLGNEFVSGPTFTFTGEGRQNVSIRDLADCWIGSMMHG